MSNDTNNNLKPYPHQQETIDNLNAEFKKGNTKQLVVLPSGSGKTHTIAFHVKELRPGSFLYVVHRDHLVTQTIKVFRKTVPWLRAADIGIINAEHKDYDKPFLFTTIQTLSKEKNLDKLSKSIGYMVIDEYHHVAADTYKKIIDYFTPKYLIGLTATPYRLDKKDIFGFINNNVAHSIDVFEGIAKKILVPFHYIGLHDDIDYKQIKWNGYSYNVSDLDRKLIIHKRDDAVIREYFDKIHPQNRLTIVFCNSVSHIKRMAKRFVKEGIKAAGIWHEQESQEKSNIIELFRQGYYKVLLTRDILNEGIDFPECDALMFLRPTISKTIFFQQLGRGLRRKEGKEDVLVLDFVGNYNKAFEKREWFLALGGQKEYTGKYIKPYYEYDHPSPVIEFDSKVIEIMELQERSSKKKVDGVSKKDILTDYLLACEKSGLDRPLNSKEYESSPHSTISLYAIRKKFGSFVDFIKECKIENYQFNSNCPNGFHSCTDKQKLIDNYFRIKKEHPEIKSRYGDYIPGPVIDDMNISHYSTQAIRRVFGNYSNFLKTIGENKNKNEFRISKRDEEYIRNERIKNAIIAIQEHLGREYFSLTEWRKYHGSLAKHIIEDLTIEGFKKKYGVPIYNSSICSICGKEYQTKFSTTTHNVCSDVCRNKIAYIKRGKPHKLTDEEWEKRYNIIIPCFYCGQQMHKYNRGLNRERKFCSKLCATRSKYYERKKEREQIKQNINN